MDDTQDTQSQKSSGELPQNEYTDIYALLDEMFELAIVASKSINLNSVKEHREAVTAAETLLMFKNS